MRISILQVTVLAAANIGYCSVSWALPPSCADSLEEGTPVREILNCIGELQEAIIDLTENVEQLPVPGTVVAATVPCDQLPGSWMTFRPATGRFVIGAGDDFDDAYRFWQPSPSLPASERPAPRPISTYDVLEHDGGEEEVMLATDELPSLTAVDRYLSGVATRNDVVREDRENMESLLTSGPSDWHSTGGISVEGVTDHWGIRFGLTQSEEMLPEIPDSSDQVAHNNMPPYIALYWCTPE